MDSNEEKLTSLEEEGPDALEVAAQAHEEGEAQKVEEVKFAKRLKKWYAILTEPTFKTDSFEQTVADYTILLLTVAFAAGLYYFLASFVRALYYQILGAHVNYLDLAQYTTGGSVSIFFFYFFAGTFLLLAASAVLKFFYRMKYTELLTVMMHSLSPVLLFGWLLPAIIALLLWSVILFFVRIRMFKAETHIRGTISERQ